MSRQMKESGVEWIGQIPEDWEIARLKNLLEVPMQYGANSSGVEYSQDLPRYIRITDITNDNQLNMDNLLSLPFEEAKPYLLEDNDILFARSGATVGKTFIYHKEYGQAAFAGYLIRATIRTSVALSNFVYYSTLGSGYEQWKNAIAIQATISNIGANKYNSYLLPLPSLSEQQRIVEYLDRKTSAIDRKIELLNKKLDAYARLKKSVIHRAVTRGLNPDVHLKDSGVEWIGQVPEHWETIRFKSVHNGGNVGISIDKEYWSSNNQDTVFYTAGLIPINTSFEAIIPSLFTHKNDLLVARNGTPYVYLPVEKAIYTDHIIRVQVRNAFDRKFIKYCLEQSIMTDMVDTVSIATWSISIWNRQILPFPPLSEQTAIADYLDDKCRKIDSAAEIIRKQIEALKRLKRAYINEAVTGKRAI